MEGKMVYYLNKSLYTLENSMKVMQKRNVCLK